MRGGGLVMQCNIKGQAQSPICAKWKREYI